MFANSHWPKQAISSQQEDKSAKALEMKENGTVMLQG